MRTAGEPDPKPAKPLGERVHRPQPKMPEWQPLQHSPCIEIDRHGRLRTNLPLPK